MEELLTNVDTEENIQETDETEVQTSETEVQNIQDEEDIKATAETVQPFEIDSSFSPPIIQIEGVNYSYYEVAYKEQIKTNALLMTILIAYVTIFACTRFYRWFRSIFTITI